MTKHFSEETRRKISEAQRARYAAFTEEEWAEFREIQQQRGWNSPESRARAKETLRKRWEDPAFRAKMYEAGQRGWHVSARNARHFTDDEVRVVRQRLAAGEKQMALAKEYGCSQTILSFIKHRKMYKNVV